MDDAQRIEDWAKAQVIDQAPAHGEAAYERVLGWVQKCRADLGDSRLCSMTIAQTMVRVHALT